MRKRTAALLVAVVAAVGTVAVSLGPCDAPDVRAPTPAVTRVESPTTAAATAAPTPVRRKKATEGETSDDDAPDDDGERFPLIVHVVAETTRAPIAGAVVEAGDIRVETDADGDATIPGLRRGDVRLDASARGYLRRGVVSTVPRDDDRLLVALDAGVVVSVEVVDAVSGRPVPGASLTFSLNDDHARPMEFVADDAGRVEAGLPPGAPCLVRTRARGHFEFLDFVRTRLLGESQPTLRVALAPSATLRGVVRDPDGGPVESAHVDVARAGGEGDGLGIDCPQTESDGSFEVDGLVLGASYTAAAAAQGNWSGSSRVAFTAAQEGAVVELRLRKPGIFALSVVDDDGASVERLEMKLTGDETESTRSGGGGSVTEELAPGRYVVKVWIPDCVPVSETFDIGEGATSTRKIVLSTGESIEGIVVDETGAPVEAAHVEPAEEPVDAAAPAPWARTGADGRFKAAHFAKGTHDVRVSPPFEFEEVVVHGVAAPSEHARFVVSRRGTLALRVVFEGDAPPAPNARIAFRAGSDDDPFLMDRILPADGRFDTAWPAGVRGAVAIAVDGFLAVTRDVDVPLGASVDLGEIRLRRGASLTGVLRSEVLGPLGGYAVVVRDAWPGGRCTTDENGRFAFDGLSPGAAWIDVNRRDCAFRVDVPSSEPVVLVERRPGRLYVTLTDAVGAPVPARRVVVRIPEGDVVGEETTDAYGVARRSLQPGKYVVEVERGPRAEVELRADDITFVKLR